MKVKAIFGPPGTGKTHKLVELAHAVAHVPSLFLSFTRSAAQEAVSRMPENALCRPSTIHSMAFQALNLSRASVVDKRKLDAFAKATGFPFKGSEEGSEDPQEGDDYLQVLSFAMNSMISWEKAYDRFGHPGTRVRFDAFCSEYDAWKKAYGYVDFDDMLMQFAAGRSRRTNRHKIVFLDEAQDCSALQWAVMDILVEGCTHVVIAGDDDQAIYEWNGANPHGMIEFIERYKGAHEVLGQSYRVPKRVHTKAVELISGVKKRVAKTFAPRRGDLGEIIRYGDIQNVDMRGFETGGGGLILVRDRWRMDELKRALNREMVPYDMIGGHSPWTSKIAEALRAGQKPEIPARWWEFYRQADLTQPVLVTVSTVHQAKGREANRVMVDLTVSAKTLLELEKDQDAEIRVQYVAITRTSKELILCGSNPLL